MCCRAVESDVLVYHFQSVVQSGFYISFATSNQRVVVYDGHVELHTCQTDLLICDYGAGHVVAYAYADFYSAVAVHANILDVGAINVLDCIDCVLVYAAAKRVFVHFKHQVFHVGTFLEHVTGVLFAIQGKRHNLVAVGIGYAHRDVHVLSGIGVVDVCARADYVQRACRFVLDGRHIGVKRFVGVEIIVSSVVIAVNPTMMAVVVAVFSVAVGAHGTIVSAGVGVQCRTVAYSHALVYRHLLAEAFACRKCGNDKHCQKYCDDNFCKLLFHNFSLNSIQKRLHFVHRLLYSVNIFREQYGILIIEN